MRDEQSVIVFIIILNGSPLDSVVDWFLGWENEFLLLVGQSIFLPQKI